MRGYVMVLSIPELIGWGSVSVAVAVIAGLYPSLKAARLEPLETLRLG
jgi:ABC-type antimicrobial peptide transport system permease subunit